VEKTLNRINHWHKQQLDLFKPENLWGDWLDDLMEKCNIPYGKVRRTCDCGVEYSFLIDRKSDILCNYRCLYCNDGSFMFNQNVARVEADGVIIYRQ